MQMERNEHDFSAAGVGQATPELHTVRDVTTDQTKAAMALMGDLENKGNLTKPPQVFEPARSAPWR